MAKAPDQTQTARHRADGIPETTLDDLVGCAGYKGPTRSLEEMEAAIARGAWDLEGGPEVALLKGTDT